MKHLFKTLGIALLFVALLADIRAQTTPQVITMQDAATATGNGTAIVIAVSAAAPGANLGAVGIQITGTFSATVTFEATTDGTNWTAVMATNLADDARATTATAAGHYTILYGSAIRIRARISSYSSGAVTVKGRLIPGLTARLTSGGGGGGGGAPTDATYITQTPNGSLSAEQALSSLASGIMRVATTTGVVTSLTDSAGIAANISDETGTGALVFATSPTLTTPTIASFANAGHDHSNAAGGGQISLTNAVTGDLPFANFVQAGSAGFVGATGAGDYSHRTPAQVTAALDAFVGDSGSGGTKGLVPAPTTGDAAKYLKGDGTWASVSAAPGGSDTQLQRNNAGAFGGISGFTSDGTNVTAGSGNLRATLPQFTTGIRDANGNLMFGFSPTGSATESITVANNTATNAVSLTATSPTQGASAIAGTGFSLTASPAIAGNTNAGAAAGGSVTITAGNAARLTSGNANGGDINLQTGTGIGTGTQGSVIVGSSASTLLQIGGSSGPKLRHLTNLGVRNSTDGGYVGIEAGSFYTKNGSTTYAQLAPSDTSSIQARNTGMISFSSDTSGFGTPDVIMTRAAAANLRFGNTDAASPVAQTLSVQNVVGGTSNTAGATWTLRASLGTGNAAPGRHSFTAGAISETSGTTQQTAVSRMELGATKVLTNNSATTIVNVTNASNTNAGGVLDYCVEVTDATEFQYECGMVTYGITNKAGVWSGNTVTKFGNHQNATSGTLTVTFAISGANPGLLSVNANSSLSVSTGYPRITYSLRNLGQQAVAIQ